jgi:hypothetical protein
MEGLLVSGSIFPRTLRGVALVVVGMLALAAPVSAHVGHGTYRIKTLDLTAEDGQFAGNYLACPSSKRAISGGAYWHRPGQGPDPSLGVGLTDSTVTSDGKGYYASGRNFSGEQLQLTIIVICLASSSVGTYTLRTDDLTIADEDYGGNYLACPAGKRVVGGGAYWHTVPNSGPGDNYAYLTSSTATSDGRGWYVSGLRNQTAPTIGLQILALCVPKAKVATYTLRTTTLTVQGGHEAGGYLACPKGKRVVTGGAYWNDIPNTGPHYQDDVLLRSSTPTSDGLGWYASGYDYSGKTMGLTISVLCLKPQ